VIAAGFGEKAHSFARPADRAFHDTNLAFLCKIRSFSAVPSSRQ
jgi:hypothetical protein